MIPKSISVDSRSTVTIIEYMLPTGSCPYLYAWDGNRFRFVTDILGASPLGLRLTDDRFIEADPDEFVWIGNESMFKPRNGQFELQITEELREVLYLDEAKLVAVDHPPDTEVHTTGKLVPGKPWRSKEIIPLKHRYALRRATRLDGPTSLLRLPERWNGRVARQLRVPNCVAWQNHTVSFWILVRWQWSDLGSRSYRLVAIRRRMANVAASHNPDLPFPFPTLEVESDQGRGNG